jgi:hypothetical protein
MTAVQFAPGMSGKSSEITNKFFDSDPSTVSSAICLSCDPVDPDAVCVSRLFRHILAEIMAEAVGPAAATVNSAAREQIQKLNLVQDIDLDAMTFAGMVQGNKIAAVVVIITGGTYTSTPQLLRLGFHQQYNTAGFRPHPVAICETYTLPDAKIVEDIQEGKVLALGPNPKATIKAFLNEDISFARVAMALSQVIEARVYMCNCPFQTVGTIKQTLKRQLIKVSLSFSATAKPAPEEPAVSESNASSFMSFAPVQQHRYMSQYYGEGWQTKNKDLDQEVMV